MPVAFIYLSSPYSLLKQWYCLQEKGNYAVMGKKEKSRFPDISGKKGVK